MQTFRDHVESRSDGEISVRLTPNIMDQGRPNTDLLDLVESGQMFLCYFSSSYLGSRVPALNVLETPFLFDDLDHAHRVLDGALGERLGSEVARLTAFELLGFWDNGFRHFTNRLRPVLTPDDCRGMRVRVQPNDIHTRLFGDWGAEPVPVELSEGIRAISSLEVDAQENPLANTVSYDVHLVHQHVTMTSHLYGARGLWANREALAALSDDLQDVVHGAARVAIATQRREARVLEVELRERLESRGLEFVDLDASQRGEFHEASAGAVELARQGVSEDLYELAEI